MEMTHDAPNLTGGGTNTGALKIARLSHWLAPYKSILRKLGIAIASVLFLAWAAKFAYHQWTFEETDDAQIAAHTAVLAAKVGGRVKNVLVEENDSVKAGQTLAQIDFSDLKNSTLAAIGDVGALRARAQDAATEANRFANLYAGGAATQQERDNAQTISKDLEEKLRTAKAQLQQARLNLTYTEVKAPANGRIGKKSVEPGMVVEAGQFLFSFTDARTPWVVANFKETQLRHMHKGQIASVEVDAIEGKTFTGKVENFAPGTGASFALIPPENATGNFTKIVQRVPVKILLDPESIKGFEERLIPGLSAEATVKVR